VWLVLNAQQLKQAFLLRDYVLQKSCGDADAVRQWAEDFATRGLPLFPTLEGIKLSVQATITPDGSVA